MKKRTTRPESFSLAALVAARRLAGVSRATLAARAKIHPERLGRIERGEAKRGIRPAELSRLLDALGGGARG